MLSSWFREIIYAVSTRRRRQNSVASAVLRMIERGFRLLQTIILVTNSADPVALERHVYVSASWPSHTVLRKLVR